MRSITARRRGASGNGSASLEVELRGTPGELVALAFAPPTTALQQPSASGWRPTTVECYVPAGGVVRVEVPERTCT